MVGRQSTKVGCLGIALLVTACSYGAGRTPKEVATVAPAPSPAFAGERYDQIRDDP